MNSSLELKQFNSTLGLSSRLADSLYVYAIPFISVVIVCLKIVSISVLTKILRGKEKYGINKYFVELYSSSIINRIQHKRFSDLCNTNTRWRIL